MIANVSKNKGLATGLFLKLYSFSSFFFFFVTLYTIYLN